MSITFLSPEAAIIGLGVAIPLIALALAETRAKLARSVLRLPPPIARGTGYIAAIGAFALLVALGAAQPILEREKTRSVREDAEAYFVIDTSKSMQAAGSEDGDQRFQRARAMAKRMRSSLSDVPVGIASLTDRILLHAFPTANDATFNLTLDRTLGIERPGSVERGGALGSSLEAVAGAAKAGYYRQGTPNRLMVLFTDAETRPFDAARVTDAFRGTGIHVIVVRVGSDSERVYERGVLDPGYRPAAGAEASAERFAEAVDGEAFSEDELGKAMSAARSAAGDSGPRASSREVDPTPLASYAFALAFLPLGFLLWRRNLR